MTNPILNHYGAYVTEPNAGACVFVPDDTCHKGTDIFIWEGGAMPMPCPDWYATLQAAEAAFIRAKCIQRLSVMAYGDGWLPTLENTGEELRLMTTDKYIETFGTGVYFKGFAQIIAADESLSDEERAAFLFIHKEGE